ncbi:MAG: tetratricopeptide repeat protein [Burkholderiales bacterium]
MLLLAICYSPALEAQQGEESTAPAAHIARNRALIADAAKLKLNPIQIGGLWAQIASDYQDLGEFTESEAAYNRALALLEPESSAQIAYAVTLSNLGSLYDMTRNYDAAENCTRRSLAVLEKLGDPLMIARAQGHLADVYLAMGRNKDALRYSALAVQAVAALPGATSDDKGSMLISYAYASCLTSHCDDGLQAAREAMKIVQTSFAPESFPAGQAHLALGYAESKSGELNAADEDLREGVRILRRQLSASHPLMIHALDIYREYLAGNHRDAEAKRIAKEQMAGNKSDCSNCTVSVHGLRRQ